jgi:hypothetical protein
MGVIGVTAAEWAGVSVSVSAISSAAGALVSASNWVLDTLQNKFVADLSEGGYQKLLPGQTFTTSQKTIGLNLRTWVIRIQKTEKAILIRRANSSVWTGATNGNTNIYNVTDKKYFKNWRTETIPVEVHIESQTESGGYTMVGSAEPECRLTESITWIHVDFEEPSDYGFESQPLRAESNDNDSNDKEDLNEVFFYCSG